MPSFYIKPVFWNTKRYERPSGARASGGFPSDYGFGAEEWNNSEKMAFSKGGVQYRAFHTPLGKAKPERSGSFVFCISSHDGVQDLVGIAGNATCLIDEKSLRQKLAKKLKLGGLWREAWEVDAGRKSFSNNKAAFRKLFKTNAASRPNWICPEDMFLWLDTPITLNPMEIVGKKRFISMFGSYQRIDSKQALTMLKCIPEQDRSPIWQRLYSTIDRCDPFAQDNDLEDIRKRKRIDKTMREALTQARIGQGTFRSGLEERWGAKCSVTGIGVREVLRASHIKSWKSSSDEERLDVGNGLLLSAHIDALFDKGLISFNNCGDMLISNRVPECERQLLGIPKPLRDGLSNTERKYLSFHRKTYGYEN